MFIIINMFISVCHALTYIVAASFGYEITIHLASISIRFVIFVTNKFIRMLFVPAANRMPDQT